jgi:hypothetical protein
MGSESRRPRWIAAAAIHAEYIAGIRLHPNHAVIQESGRTCPDRNRSRHRTGGGFSAPFETRPAGGLHPVPLESRRGAANVEGWRSERRGMEKR